MKKNNSYIIIILLVCWVIYLSYQIYTLKDELETNELILNDCINNPNFKQEYETFHENLGNDINKRLKNAQEKLDKK